MSKVEIGDILEIPTAKGLAYAQYTHQHRMFGGLIRVFDSIFDSRPDDLSKLANGPVRFSTFLPVKVAVQRDIFKVAGHQEVMLQNKVFPLFRDGVADSKTKKVAIWWLWDGEKEWSIGSLTPEQRQLPIRQTLNDTMLVKLIEDGWTPANDSE